MKKQIKIMTILLIGIYSNCLLLAQNYNDALLLSESGISTNPRSLGMGNSYTAISNDFSGVIFNPAGLGMIKKSELSMGLNYNSFHNETTFFNNVTAADKNGVNLSQIGLVFPLPTIQGSWVFALGYNRVKDFNKTIEFDGFNSGNNSMIQAVTGDINDEIPITNDLGLAYEIVDQQTERYIRDTTLVNGMLNQSGRTRKQGSIGNWSFASSIEVAKGFYLGGTFNIVSGSYKSDNDFWEDDTKNIYGPGLELVPGDATTSDFQSFYMNDIIEWDLSGWDAKLGLLYNWKDHFRFGASIKFPTYYTVEESFFVDANSTFGSGSAYQLDPAIVDNLKYDIKTPYEYSFGAAMTLAIVTISADTKIIDYTQMEFTEGFDQQYIIERNREIDDLFTTTINFNLGSEIKIPGLPVYGRIGAMYFQSPYANDPGEFDKKYFTAGAGIVLGNAFRLDLAYSYGWWDDYGDNYGVNQSRTFQTISSQNMVLGISTSF